MRKKDLVLSVLLLNSPVEIANRFESHSTREGKGNGISSTCIYCFREFSEIVIPSRLIHVLVTIKLLITGYH